MTKEELEKEAEEKYCKGCKLRMEQCLWAWRKTNGLNEPNEKNCSCKKVPAYIAGAEPREKRIAELEEKNERLKGDLELWESGACRATNLDKCGVVKELEAQIEKLIDFVLSKTECCDVCPITDTCINSEGTCPYAGILSKGEEAVTREWLMQKIEKEIKEK